jgi:hypothetical protein
LEVKLMPSVENGRSLAEVVRELKEELRDFVQTRVDMLRFEVRDKARTWKTALPMIGVALVLLVTAWLVLTGALIALMASAFYPSRFAFFFAFLIVGGCYALFGSMCAAFAYRGIKTEGIAPQRTIKVLREDANWLQTEARSQL